MELTFNPNLWRALSGAGPFPGCPDSRKGGPIAGPFFAELPLGLGDEYDGANAVLSVSFTDGSVVVGIDATPTDGRRASLSGTLVLGPSLRPEAAKAVALALVRWHATKAELVAIGFEFSEV